MVIPLKYPLLLASGSPRRKEIMTSAGFNFDVEVRPTDESFDPSMRVEEIPVFLAKQKLSQFEGKKDTIVLCADTIVVIGETVLNKPANNNEAFEMLQLLNGKKHQVITGVAFMLNGKVSSFHDITDVSFNMVTDEELKFYIENWKPFDKAGGYGIQEFMGMIGIESLKGSYYNVMGLPIHKVYQNLKNYIKW